MSKVPESWKRQYFMRLQDLVDQLEPDYMYHDGVIRFEKYGLSLVAHLYNQSAQCNGGRVEAVYACKGVEDCQTGTCVLDFERGIAEGIWPQPFKRIPASAAGITTAISNTKLRRKWWICWSM